MSIPVTAPFPNWDVAAPINAVAFCTNGRTAMAAAGDGHVYLMRAGMAAPVAIAAGDSSAVLCLVPSIDGCWAGTDSGEVGWVPADGTDWSPVASFPGKFIESMAYDAKTGLLAVAVGKNVVLLNGQGQKIRELGPHSSSVQGLAVSPKGARLAVSHYNAVTIWPLDNPKASPRVLEWKGVHQQLTYSPDGTWLISGMQEQAIHLWRLSDGLDLQMRGYPGKINQFSWCANGHTLATTGGFGVPLWSFKDKLKGPAGSSANVVADSGSNAVLVTAIACHPKGPFAAVGYSDGLVLLVNLNDDKAVLVKAPKQAHAVEEDASPALQPITGLAWSPDGLFLAAGSDDGWLSLVDFAQLA